MLLLSSIILSICSSCRSTCVCTQAFSPNCLRLLRLLLQGEKMAPVLTLVVGGNHEASNYFLDLFHGGWLAPNIYFLGMAGVVRLRTRRDGEVLSEGKTIRVIIHLSKSARMSVSFSLKCLCFSVYLETEILIFLTVALIFRSSYSCLIPLFRLVSRVHSSWRLLCCVLIASFATFPTKGKRGWGADCGLQRHLQVGGLRKRPFRSRAYRHARQLHGWRARVSQNG